MTGQAEQLLAAFRVPDLYLVIDAAGDNLAAVRTEGGIGGRALVPVERLQFLAGGGIPEFDRAVSATGKDPFTVRAIGRRRHGALVACQRLDRRGVSLLCPAKL